MVLQTIQISYTELNATIYIKLVCTADDFHQNGDSSNNASYRPYRYNATKNEKAVQLEFFSIGDNVWPFFKLSSMGKDWFKSLHITATDGRTEGR